MNKLEVSLQGVALKNSVKEVVESQNVKQRLSSLYSEEDILTDFLGLSSPEFSCFEKARRVFF